MRDFYREQSPRLDLIEKYPPKNIINAFELEKLLAYGSQKESIDYFAEICSKVIPDILQRLKIDPIPELKLNGEFPKDTSNKLDWKNLPGRGYRGMSNVVNIAEARRSTKTIISNTTGEVKKVTKTYSLLFTPYGLYERISWEKHRNETLLRENPLSFSEISVVQTLAQELYHIRQLQKFPNLKIEKEDFALRFESANQEEKIALINEREITSRIEKSARMFELKYLHLYAKKKFHNKEIPLSRYLTLLAWLSVQYLAIKTEANKI